MESRVSSLETRIEEVQQSQEKVQANLELIMGQLQALIARGNGGFLGNSAATPTHQPFIKSTSPLSRAKSNEIVLKLQSFHKEKVQAREKRDEFWSQFRPRYKTKTRPGLRPILKKFKKVHDYDKYHEDDSAKFRSSSKFQDFFGFFRSKLARKNEKVFDLLEKQVEDSVKSPPFRPILENKVGFQLIVFVGTISKLQSLKNLDHDFLIRFDVGFILDAKQMLLPPEGVAVHLGHNVFDEMPHSTNNCVLQLGYHMPISDSGGTLITGHFTSKFQVKDAYNSNYFEIVNITCKIGFKGGVLLGCQMASFCGDS
ncbi:unnamed protein product [Malus baccata var. baccata]